MNICNGQVFATNMTGSTFLGGVEGTGISNLIVRMTDRTLQFNHNYIMTMEVGKRDRSVLRLGDLSMLPLILVDPPLSILGSINNSNYELQCHERMKMTTF